MYLAAWPRSGASYLTRVLEGCGLEVKRVHNLERVEAVLLVRDPFCTIESFYRWRQEYAPVSWEKHLEECVVGPYNWAKHTMFWWGSYRVHYEDLCRDPVGEVGMLLDWLGVPDDRLKAVPCGCRGRPAYSKADTDYILKHFADTMERCGYA